ncbi:hypothetical protein AB1Y20_020862 [Prymnesium parvum]|uniref:Uncharacterized protein n=1 Tax=Prymnesium parvum TaxID=97485 RepID=A0AB34JVX7_PRYPA
MAALLPLLGLAAALRRAPPPRMGGLTGLPRIPSKALRLTRGFNPSCAYTEPIATLWRDLETLYGYEGVVAGGSRTQRDSSRLARGGATGKFRGLSYNVDLRAETVYAMVRKEPSLLDPEVSNRFTFVKSKAILVEKLGSEKAAIELMLAQPAILREGDALQEKTAAEIKAAVLLWQLRPALAGLAVAALALTATDSLGFRPWIDLMAFS